MDASRAVEPQTTVAVILGASAWPRSPRLEAAPAFARSAADIMAYLTAGDGFALPRENMLDLFDSDAEAIEIQDRIRTFLSERSQNLEAAGTKLRDVLVFYVGHGAFDEGSESEFFLAIRRTREDNELASSLSAQQLARTVHAGRRNARRYVILDCCFAGAAVGRFILQSALADTMEQKLRHEFPREGTAMLCSSSARDPSKAPRGETHTMFSGALVEVLRSGDPGHAPVFSLETLCVAVSERLQRKFANAATRPEIHGPDQRAGLVAQIPLFRNAAANIDKMQALQARITATGMVARPEVFASIQRPLDDDPPPRAEQPPKVSGYPAISREQWAQIPRRVRGELQRIARWQADSSRAWLRTIALALGLFLALRATREVGGGLFIGGTAFFGLFSSLYYIAKGLTVLAAGEWAEIERVIPAASGVSAWERVPAVDVLRRPRALKRFRFVFMLCDLSREDVSRMVLTLTVGVVAFGIAAAVW